MTSASVTRSAVAAWAEYPGVVCARRGNASKSASTDSFFITSDSPWVGFVQLKWRCSFVQLFERERDSFSQACLAIRSRRYAAGKRIEFR